MNKINLSNILSIFLVIFCFISLTGCQTKQNHAETVDLPPNISNESSQNNKEEDTENENAEEGNKGYPNSQDKSNSQKEEDPEENQTNADIKTITIRINNKDFRVYLYDNETVNAFIAQLPMTINMGELNGNEKYYYLPNRLPTNAEYIENIRTGDLMLYGADCLVLFYEDFQTSYSYTKIGYIENPSDLAGTLGRNNIQATFIIS